MSAIRKIFMGHDETIEKLAALINEALPLAKAVVSKEYSDRERERLRQLCGLTGVFDLSNYTHGLCSRTARQNVLQEFEQEMRIAQLKSKSWSNK